MWEICDKFCKVFEPLTHHLQVEDQTQFASLNSVTQIYVFLFSFVNEMVIEIF